MDEIASDRTQLETPTATELETAYSVKTRRPSWREDGLLSVLDHYMAVVARASALIG